MKRMAAVGITVMLLAGCTVEKGHTIVEQPDKSVIDENTVDIVEPILFDDETLARKAWKEITVAERATVKEKPYVVKKHPGNSKELMMARSLAKKSKKLLRVIYFETADEKYHGKLLVYAVGNEFVAKSPRHRVQLATEKEMDKWVKESNTMKELEEKLRENHKWSETVFDTGEWSLKEDKSPSPDKRFFQMAEGYYGVPHHREVITNIKPTDEKMYSQVMIEDRYGDVIEDSTN